METKILLQDLAEALAAHKQLSKKKAEQFTRTFFEVIQETLQTERSVKIKGLGTFKLMTVSSRESINVTTGERFDIEEHEKIAFTPDPTLRDIINKPFAQFETVVLNNDTDLKSMRYLDQNSQEDVDFNEGENNNLPTGGQLQEELIVSTQEIVENPVSSDIELVQASLQDIQVEEQDEDEETNEDEEQKSSIEKAEETEKTEENVAVQIVRVLEETSNAGEIQTESSSRIGDRPVTLQKNTQPSPSQGLSWGKAILLFITILLLMIGSYLAGSYNLLVPKDIYLRLMPKATTDEVLPTVIPAPDPISNERIDSANDSVDLLANEANTVDLELSKEEIKESEDLVKESESEALKYAQFPGGRYEIIGTKGTHVVAKDESLSIISRMYYGSKGFVNYIVVHNNIDHPDLLEKGDVIKLPDLRKRD